MEHHSTKLYELAAQEKNVSYEEFENHISYMNYDSTENHRGYMNYIDVENHKKHMN